MSKSHLWLCRNVLLAFTAALGSVACAAPTRPSGQAASGEWVPVQVLDGAALFDWDTRDSARHDLSDARVETISGPQVGVVATPMEVAGYEFHLPVGDYRVRVSKEGYEGYETDLRVVKLTWTSGSSLTLYLNRAPHSLRGKAMHLPAGTPVTILDGPNAGRTALLDADHVYRIEGLQRSSPFSVQFGSQQVVRFANASEETISDFVHHATLHAVPPSYRLTGTVEDDNRWLHDPTNLHSRPVSGAIVEVLDGSTVVNTATTSTAGAFSVTTSAAAVTLRVRSVGFETRTVAVTPPTTSLVTITLGRPLHTLLGEVRDTLTLSRLVAGARAEVIDGPNSGKVAIANAAGTYRFDDLVTSSPFHLRISAPGYVDATYLVPDSREGLTGDFVHSSTCHVYMLPVGR